MIQVGDPSPTHARNHRWSSEEFRYTLGHLPTGVTAVTASDSEGDYGMAVGSFVSVSMEPPLVGFFPGKSSSTWPKLCRVGTLGVSFLAGGQGSVASALAGSGDKFAGGDWFRGDNSALLAGGALAWMECEIASVSDAGDHWFALCRIRAMRVNEMRQPDALVHFRGRYGALAD